MKKQIFKIYAFTLAEVLIVLGIIGIVAAMTIPTLMQHAQERATVSQLRKVYSTLTNAFNLAVNENGYPTDWGLGTMNDTVSNINIANKFIPHLKLLKNCVGMTSSTEIKEKCGDFGIYANEYARATLSDGTYISFRLWDGSCSSSYGATQSLSNVCGQINVDINGAQQPNKLAKDRFVFKLSKYSVIPAGTPGDRISFKNYCIKDKLGQAIGGYVVGEACTAWIIYSENMDYLHCDGLLGTEKPSAINFFVV